MAPRIKYKNMHLSVHPFTIANLYNKFILLIDVHFTFKYSLVFTLHFTL